MSYVTKSEKENMEPVEIDFCMFTENNKMLSMENNDREKRILHIKFSSYEFPIDLHYDEEYPKGKYSITIPSKKMSEDYEHFWKRCNGVLDLNKPETLSQVLELIIQLKKDEDIIIEKSKTDPSEIIKRLNKLYDDKREEVMKKEMNTVLSFNANSAFKQLKEDLIEVTIHPNKYNLTITAKDNNPYVWVVNFNKFKKGSLIEKGLDHLEDLTLENGIVFQLKFSPVIFPVVPPDYDFIKPKMFNHKLEKIFKADVFNNDDAYNPCTKLECVEFIRQQIELYGEIDFGIVGETVKII